VSRRAILAAAGIAAGTIAAAALVLAVGLGDGAPEPQADPSSIPDVRSGARATFSPATHRFGDDVAAVMELRVPKNQLQLETLRASASFDPYEVVGRKREVLDAGPRWLVRYTVTLRCLKEACLPRGRTGEFQPDRDGAGFSWFAPPPPGRKFADRRLDSRRASFAFPPLTVVSRLGPEDARDVNWRSTLAEIPPAGYAVSPGALSAGLLATAVALVLAAALLVAFWFRREARARAVAVAEEEVVLPPLEQALALVRQNGDGERRRLALQTLARELRRGGEPRLADEAERLAWSEAEPDDRAVGALASAVRQGATA
jgi:hypothetical protein